MGGKIDEPRNPIVEFQKKPESSHGFYLNNLHALQLLQMADRVQSRAHPAASYYSSFMF